MKKLLIIISIMILATAYVSGEEYTIQNISSDDIQFNFSNFRFVKYENREALSIDFEATVKTSFLGRNIIFSKIELLCYSNNLEKLLEICPQKLNSSTYGKVINLNKNGKLVEKKEDIINNNEISGIDTESGDSQKGSLLFILPDRYTLIYGLEYKDVVAEIRKEPNLYIEINEDTLNYYFIKHRLSQTIVATEGDMNLLKILINMKNFFEMNRSLKKAW